MTDDVVELGGNIQLSGFKDVEKALLVVIKKVVGSYARKFSDGLKDFEKLSVGLSGKSNIKATLNAEGQEFVAESKADNLFFALDAALKDIESKAGIESQPEEKQ